MKKKSTTHTQRLLNVSRSIHAGYKIKGNHRLAIYKMIAMGMNPALIAQEIFNDFGIKISRQAILAYYVKNPNKRKIISRVQAQADRDVMRQPLAHAKHRLAYLLRGINYALTRSTDKLYTYEGDIIAKLEKVNHGALAPLIREAREEVALLTGKPPNDPGVHVKLTTIVKDVARIAEQNGFSDRGPGRALFDGNEDAANRVDIQSFGDIQIFGRSSRHPAINTGSNSQE